MDTATIEKAIADGPEAVQRLIESESDRRVNAALETARGKWETELPQRVDTEIAKRQEQEQRQAEEREAITSEINKRFDGTGIDSGMWADLIDVDGLLSLEGEERTAAIDQQTERIVSTFDRIVKARFSTAPPEGTPPGDLEDNAESAFRKTLLENMR